MNLLFTLTTSETAASKIADTNFEQHYPAVNRNMNWLKFQPYIRQATEDVISYIGQKFYDVVQADYVAGGVVAMQVAIREKLQDAIAYRAVYKAAPHLNVTLSDMGVQQTGSENATSQPVTQWRYKALRKTSLSEYYSKLDQALYQMEQNISDTFLSEFKASAEYVDYTTAYFHHTATLSRYINIQKSRRTYIAMIPHLRRAERDLQKILCTQAAVELLTKIDLTAPDPITPEHTAYEQLIDNVRHYLANRALVIGIPRLRVLLEDDGIKVVTETDGFDTKNPANKEMIKDFLFQANEDATLYHNEILSQLRGNLDIFTTYAEHGYSESRSAGVIVSDDGVGGLMIS